MLSRPRTQASRKSAVRWLNEPKFTRSLHGQRVGGELADGERGAVDGQRRDHRVDAGAVGESGVDHRAGLVHATTDAGHDLVDGAAEVVLVAELGVDQGQLAASLQVDLAGTVDHDLGDVGVAEEGLDRTVAEDVVGDLEGHLGAVGAAERPLLRPDDLLEHLPDPGGEVVLVDVGVVELGAELLEQLGVHGGLEVLDPAVCLGRGERAATSHGRVGLGRSRAAVGAAPLARCSPVAACAVRGVLAGSSTTPSFVASRPGERGSRGLRGVVAGTIGGSAGLGRAGREDWTSGHLLSRRRRLGASSAVAQWTRRSRSGGCHRARWTVIVPAG